MFKDPLRVLAMIASLWENGRYKSTTKISDVEP